MSDTILESQLEGLRVLEWCPNDRAGNPTQVHLAVTFHEALQTPLGPVRNPGGLESMIVVRFKGPDTISELIDALTWHRDNVWG